ncbi:MAG: RidA family protein [Candidatus Izemoplasmatales bacterium]|nr:RidA family protein [Candidatus Izemoplasmatales bacterium]
MKYIETTKAPKAIGPYSQAVLVNDILFVSGQLPFDPIKMASPSEDISKQTRQSLENIKRIVEAAGFSIQNIAKCTVYLKDMEQFSAMNSVYQDFFEGHRPARVAIEVARLPKDVLIEIDAICVRDK